MPVAPSSGPISPRLLQWHNGWQYPESSVFPWPGNARWHPPPCDGGYKLVAQILLFPNAGFPTRRARMFGFIVRLVLTDSRPAPALPPQWPRRCRYTTSASCPDRSATNSLRLLSSCTRPYRRTEDLPPCNFRLMSRFDKVLISAALHIY